MSSYLILQAERDQAVSIAKLLKKADAKSHIVGGYTGKKPHFFYRSSYFDEYKQIDYSDPELFKPFDTVIPTAADSTEKMVSLFKEIQLGTVKFNARNFIVSDKLKMFEVIKKLNIPYPTTYSELSSIENFPVFYKNKFENVAGKRRGVIHDKTSLSQLQHPEELIFQEYIPGTSTFGVAFLADDGRLTSTISHEEKISYPKTGGSAALISVVENQRLVELTKKIINDIHYTGWGLAEFKFCPKRNDFVFMEINPKFWASIEFSMLKEPAFAQELLGITLEKSPASDFLYKHRIAGMKKHEHQEEQSAVDNATPIEISKRRTCYFCLKKYLK